MCVSSPQIIAYIQSAAKSTTVQDADLITLVWNGLLSNLDNFTAAGSSDQQVNDAVLKWIKNVNPVLAAFTQNARTQIALMCVVIHPCFSRSSVALAGRHLADARFACDVRSTATPSRSSSTRPRPGSFRSSRGLSRSSTTRTRSLPRPSSTGTKRARSRRESRRSSKGWSRSSRPSRRARKVTRMRTTSDGRLISDLSVTRRKASNAMHDRFSRCSQRAQVLRQNL